MPHKVPAFQRTDLRAYCERCEQNDIPRKYVKYPNEGCNHNVTALFTLLFRLTDHRRSGVVSLYFVDHAASRVISRIQNPSLLISDSAHTL